MIIEVKISPYDKGNQKQYLYYKIKVMNITSLLRKN